MNSNRRFHQLAFVSLCLALAGCGGDEGTTPGGLGMGGTGGAVAGAGAVSGNSAQAGSSPSTGGVAGSSPTGGAAGRMSAAGTGSGASGTGSMSGRSGAGGASAGRGATSGTGGAAGMGAGAGTGSSAGSGASAGSSGAAGAAGSGGDAGFKPCPATGECKILPLGDSITVGLGFSGGYRVHLFELAVMNMKKITFVGAITNGPSMVAGMPFPKKFEAVSGITISGIDGHIPSPGLNDVPHIVLIHIGTNDMYMSPSGAPDRLGTLIDGVIAGAPDALIVVAKIIPLPMGAAAVKTFNDALPAVVQKRADAGKHVILVDLFTGFPTSELGDGVHPNQAGYSRMAEKWYGAISSYLN